MVSRSRANLDVSQVLAFQAKLVLTAELADKMGEKWQQEHGEKWAAEMRNTVPVGPGEPVHLKDEVRQIEPGGITFGRAFWWRFLEYGTVKMSPRPFVKPAMKRIRTPARKDAVNRAVELMQGKL
jgi:HK97 gp10 family phage protein